MKAQFLNVVDLGEDVAPGAQAAYSQGYEILSDDDPYNRIYFLFLDGKCRGVLVVTYANGEFASSFTPSRLPTISDALLSGEPFRLHTYGESLIYCGMRHFTNEEKLFCTDFCHRVDTVCGYTGILPSEK